MAPGQKLIAALLVLLLIASIGTGFYFYNKYQSSQHELQLAKTDPSTLQKAAQEEVKRLVADVSKLMELPTGEDPTVATITDIDKLKDQPFFQKAKNGDKVLIYTNAKKAILYDPTIHKILDVAPVNIGSSSAQQTQARLVLRNGTSNAGATSKVEADLKKSFPDVNIVLKDGAARADYEKTIVVPLDPTAKDAATNLATNISATEVDALPAGENKPGNADILILIGRDKAGTPPPPVTPPNPPAPISSSNPGQ